MLNEQITMGRLTATPELKRTASGIPVTSFTIASDEDRKREDGTVPTDFVDCVAWRGTAEFICKYMTKGRLIVVKGRPKARKYKDKNDVTHKVVELVVQDVYFCDSKRVEDDGSPQPAPPAASDFAELTDDDSELPF